MNLATRTILILTLMFAAFGELFAQETATTTTATSTATTATTATTDTATTDTATTTAEGAEKTDDESAAPAEAGTPQRATLEEVRDRFTSLLRQYPYEVGAILKLDPSLMSDPTFMARYPDIAAFLAEHPQVRQHPRYFLSQVYTVSAGDNSVVDDIIETVAVACTFVVIGLILAWIVRTIVEQKRWSRLSKTQNEVHNKILDRFGTSTELLEYMRTPAGTKFLESAPIPLHTPSRSTSSRHPYARVIWSVQLGVIVGAAAVGMLLVSLGLEKDDAQALFAMGVIALCVGVGFIGSAAVSVFMSRRLGLWEMPQRTEDPELVQ